MQGLAHANPEDICNCFGMGLSKRAQIQAAYELVKRCLQETLYQGAIFSSPPSELESFYRPKLDDYPMRFSYVYIWTLATDSLSARSFLEGQLTALQFTQERLLKVSRAKCQRPDRGP